MQYFQRMKVIAVEVSEAVYLELEEYARRHELTTEEVIREAMEAYRGRWARRRGGSSLRDLRPLDLGEVKRPWGAGDDLLDEMLR